MRRSLRVLEVLRVSPARVLIGCVVLLAVIFAVDIFTPRSDYFAILYIVPAATAAVLPSRWAAGALASALGLQITGLLLQRSSVATVLAGAVSLIFVIVVVRLLSVASRQPKYGSQGAAPVAGSMAELGTLDNQLQRLTKRERQVAELVAEGRSAREIAGHLHIGRRTVETHVARAYAKLGMTSRVELILRRGASSNRQR